MLSEIKQIFARQILDSYGNPTIEVDIILESGAFGRAVAPSKSYIKTKEELVKNENKNILLKNSVYKSIKNINDKIFISIKGLDALDQRLIDKTMIEIDRSENKNTLDTNAILVVSLASARAAASHLKKPFYRYLMDIKEYLMPVPMINIINNELYNNDINIKEFMIIPTGFNKFSDALRCSVEIFHKFKKIVISDGHMIFDISNKGSYILNLKSNEMAIKLILKAIKEANYEPGKHVFIALESANNKLYKNGQYNFKYENKLLTAKEIINYYSILIDEYPIISIEDALGKNDLEGWKLLTKKLGKKVQLVGDSLFAANSNILTKGIKNGIANSISIKLNQISTLTEAFETMTIAGHAGYTCIVSHLSSDTSDTIIADLSVATCSGQIKAGPLSSSNNISKYNQLLRIEEELGENAIYPGIKSFIYNN